MVIGPYLRQRPAKGPIGPGGRADDEARAPAARLEEAYAEHELDRLDGLTVTADDWWFNVRPSNTEPLLRLNVEGADDATMARVRDDVLGLIRS